MIRGVVFVFDYSVFAVVWGGGGCAVQFVGSAIKYRHSLFQLVSLIPGHSLYPLYFQPAKYRCYIRPFYFRRGASRLPGVSERVGGRPRNAISLAMPRLTPFLILPLMVTLNKYRLDLVLTDTFLQGRHVREVWIPRNIQRYISGAC